MRPPRQNLSTDSKQQPYDTVSDAEASLDLGYSTRVELSLEPRTPANRALAELFRHLLGVIRATERDLTTRRGEVFLHDYRVAVRRTRSALGRFGELLPPETLEWAKAFFADLGRRTGNARDLDVLLLELPAYSAPLPATTRQILSRTVGRCEEDVRLEYALLGRWLARPSYRDDLERWQRAIDKLERSRCATTIAEAAAAAIEETSSKVFRRMERLRKAKKGKRVHRLRVSCKKLRYALEFSRSLTPGGEIEQLITSLKGLQDVLGTHNDLVVHEARLRASQSPSSDADLESATARLIGEIEARRHSSRKRVRSAVGNFQLEGPPDVERVLRRLRQPSR